MESEIRNERTATEGTPIDSMTTDPTIVFASSGTNTGKGEPEEKGREGSKMID